MVDQRRECQVVQGDGVPPEPTALGKGAGGALSLAVQETRLQEDLAKRSPAPEPIGSGAGQAHPTVDFFCLYSWLERVEYAKIRQ